MTAAPPRPPGRSTRAAGAVALAALTAGPLRAQSTGARAAGPTTLPLRDALERVAAAAHVRLSYSRELIGADRPVCPPTLDADPVAALGALLRGTGIEAVPVGGGQIVLAPAAHAAGEVTTTPSRLTVLDRVVVTGSPAGAPARALPVALSVLDGGTLASGRAQVPLSTALDGTVPGLWLWTQPTTSVLARYGGVRGASSFGLTTPKLYLDGIEVANPLFVTALTAEQVERVEVIRGPQGAALYGADAISGVINVVTRHDGAEAGRADLTFRTGLGAAGTSSLVAARPALAQDYGLTLRAGHGAQTGGLAVAASTLGPVVPGSTSRQITAVADGRRVSPKGVLTLTARFADAAAPPACSLVAGQSPSSCAVDTASRQHVSELTLAATGVRTAGGRWTQTLTAGLDAYRLAGVANQWIGGISSALDSAQRAAQGTAARATLRGSTTATFDVGREVAFTATGIADYGLLREATRLDNTATSGARVELPRGDYDSRRRGNRDYAGGTPNSTPITTLGTGGLVGQTTLAWRDAVFLTAGLRLEHNDGLTDADRTALLPSLGLSVVRDLAAGTTLKLRGAYGSGLRPARTAARALDWRAFGGGVLPVDLAPESQTGVEAGADLFATGGDGRSFALHLTGFDQRASGLIQQVSLAPSAIPYGDLRTAAACLTAGPDGFRSGAPRSLGYALQNVGVIANRGVETEAQFRPAPGRVGALAFSGTLTYVDSHVERTAAGYTGDLRAGDRVLEVPRFTFGANATWRRAGWSATLGATRAADWINYDRLRLNAVAANPAYTDSSVSGAALRTYWRSYAGVTRLRAEFARDLSRGLTLTVLGENLLDRQRNEPDNATVLPGRTITAGFRARF